ncbi:MAG: hypothetical protein R2784_04810 [Saprospiraceae bacterium]
MSTSGNAVLISDNGNEVCVQYTSAGGGVISVTPSNPCFPGVPSITGNCSTNTTYDFTTIFLLSK